MNDYYKTKVRCILDAKVQYIELISDLTEEELSTILSYNCEIVRREKVKGKIPEE